MLSLCVMPALRASHALSSTLAEYVRAVMDNATEANISAHLFQLASLPIPQPGLFDVADPDRWRDPLADVDTLPASSRDGADSKWGSAIGGLIESVKSDDDGKRKIAIGRLARLHEAGLLNETERKDFGDALWCLRKPQSGLPAATGMYDFATLHLPEPTPGIASETFKKFYLSEDLPPIIKKVTLPDGRPGEQMELGAGRPSFFVNVIRGTRYQDAQHEDDWKVDWTEAEALQLFDVVERWWTSEGEALTARPKETDKSVFFRRDLTERADAILDVIAAVVLPRLAEDGAPLRRVRQLLDALERAGGSAESAWGVLAVTCPSESATAASKLRQGLASADPRRGRVAAKGVLEWCHGAVRQKSALPRDLLYELGYVVSGRRQPLLLPALQAAAALLNEYPTVIDARFIELLLTGLEYLYPETEYRAVPPDATAPVPYDLVPIARTAGARLANALAAAGNDDNSAVKRWLVRSKDDPLSYVRRAVLANDK
jgi:hypothetical protein